MPIGSSLLLDVFDVRRDHHAAAGDLGADEFRVQVFPLGDVGHLGRDGALPGGFELGHRSADCGVGNAEWQKSAAVW